MENNNEEEVLKLYSQKAIAIAAYFGGPLAAGVLIRRNCLNLGQARTAKYALLSGILSTFLLIGVLLIIPENIIDKIPNYLIPAVYTGIIYLIAGRIHGKEFEKYKGMKEYFYSQWKAAGVGVVSLLIIIAGGFGYIFLSPDDLNTADYNYGITQIQENEETALVLFDLLETEDFQEAADFISETGIPLWQKNLSIIEELDFIEGLTDEYVMQNQILREYCNLQIKSYTLIRKSIVEDTDLYDIELELINNRIDELFEQF